MAAETAVGWRGLTSLTSEHCDRRPERDHTLEGAEGSERWRSAVRSQPPEGELSQRIALVRSRLFYSIGGEQRHRLMSGRCTSR